MKYYKEKRLALIAAARQKHRAAEPFLIVS